MLRETIQEPFSVLDGEGVAWTLSDLLVWLFEDAETDSTDEEGTGSSTDIQQRGDRYSNAVTISGICVPMDTPLQWLAEHLAHPDQFVHIILDEKLAATGTSS